MNSQRHFFHNKKSKDNIFSNIEKVIDYIYSQNFSKILIEEKTKFINNIQAQVLEFIKHQYKENDFQYQRELSNFDKNKDSIKSRYESDYFLLNLEYTKYKKYPNKVPYLVKYRKHCFNSDQIPTHKCSANKYGKFIEVFQKNNKNNSKNLSNRATNENNSYVICTECSTCYMSSLIKSYCPSCKYEYITSKLEENEKENLFPATWKEYHCQPIIVNEMMKCIKCENILYINLYTKKLVCLNKKCNFSSNPQNILWKCKICKKDFRSSAKVFNPLESKILQNEVWKSLLYKEPALPKKIFCCKLNECNKNIKFYHDKKCKGELYKGSMDGKEIVVCNLCHAVNFNEKFIWTCPVCQLRYNFNGKKHRNEINKNLVLNNNSKLSLKNKYTSENKPLSEIIKNENDKEKLSLTNKIKTVHKHNYSTNIKLFIPDNENNTNKNKDNNKLFYENNLTIPSIEINNNTIEFNKNIKKEIEILKKPICISNKNIPKPKYSKKKKKVRYQTLLDILEEREKYKINNQSRDDSFNNMNLTNEKNKLKEYYSKKRLKLLEQSKPQTSMKKDKKTLFQKYFAPNERKSHLINNLINKQPLNSKKEQGNNIINISDLEEKKLLYNKYNNLNQYESALKNLQKKLSVNYSNYSSKIIGTVPESKAIDLRASDYKDQLYSKRYKNEQISISNDENEIVNFEKIVFKRKSKSKRKSRSKRKSKKKSKSKNRNLSKNQSYKYKINIDKKKDYLRESNINLRNNNSLQNILTRKNSENNIKRNLLQNDLKDGIYYTNSYHINNFNEYENKENKENNNFNKNETNKEMDIIEENNINNEQDKNKDNKLKYNVKVYKSSRLKKNQIFKKIFLNKIKKRNNMREKEKINFSSKSNNIIENSNNNFDIHDNLELQISPFGDVGQDVVTKDDFLKIANECKIPTYNEKNIEYLNPIGQGSYGVIYSVEEKDTKNQFALKSVLCQDIEQILKHKKEFELCYSLNHENMIKIYNVLFKYFDMTTYLLYVLMEKAETDWNKEIESRIKSENFYTETELIDIMKQLVNVLCYFQKNNMAHRDIKPQNILICKNNLYKITDLGEAKYINNTDELSTLKGSQLFMSPNLFFVLKYEGNGVKVKHNIFKSDVFSLGYCFLYAMSLDLKLIKCLREETSMHDVFSVITKFGIEKKYSEKFMNIIYKMIQTDENKRCDFIELNEEINKIY